MLELGKPGGRRITGRNLNLLVCALEPGAVVPSAPKPCGASDFQHGLVRGSVRNAMAERNTESLEGARGQHAVFTRGSIHEAEPPTSDLAELGKGSNVAVGGRQGASGGTARHATVRDEQVDRDLAHRTGLCDPLVEFGGFLFFLGFAARAHGTEHGGLPLRPIIGDMFPRAEPAGAQEGWAVAEEHDPAAQSVQPRGCGLHGRNSTSRRKDLGAPGVGSCLARSRVLENMFRNEPEFLDRCCTAVFSDGGEEPGIPGDRSEGVVHIRHHDGHHLGVLGLELKVCDLCVKGNDAEFCLLSAFEGALLDSLSEHLQAVGREARSNCARARVDDSGVDGLLRWSHAVRLGHHKIHAATTKLWANGGVHALARAIQPRVVDGGRLVHHHAQVALPLHAIVQPLDEAIHVGFAPAAPHRTRHAAVHDGHGLLALFWARHGSHKDAKGLLQLVDRVLARRAVVESRPHETWSSVAIIQRAERKAGNWWARLVVCCPP
mmetsp:Transcript_3447/g.10035  ORF Transcript_3447/g.10035 Transcript_3447/m.10035 type:complete len:492 (-) Transcript_3447:27-1502(-)